MKKAAEGKAEDVRDRENLSPAILLSCPSNIAGAGNLLFKSVWIGFLFLKEASIVTAIPGFKIEFTESSSDRWRKWKRE